jgi:phage-related protein
MAAFRAKDILETGILYALYAKDAIIKGVHSAATWVQVGATTALTAGQWLLNAAFLASPIGWIVLGIGLIVGAFVLLWQKCEPFRQFFIGMWEGFKVALSSFGGFFKGVINGILSGINWLISKFLGGINGLIDGVNSISGAIGIPAIPHIPIPQIPMLWQGGEILKGGRVIVGERGAEVLDLPTGARVTPLDRASNTTQNTITMNIYVSGNTADEVINEIVPKLKLALANL